MRIRNLLSVAAIAAIGGFTSSSFAQAWPTKPVSLVVPFAPAGSTDLVARALQPGLEAAWKQPAIVENRPGAGGMVGAAEVVRAPADGYTLLFQANGVKLAPLFQKDIPYNPADLRPVVGIANAYYVLVAGAKQPFKNMKEFIAFAKANPGKYHVGTTPYTPVDLEIAGIMEKAGIQNYQSVGYNGSAALVQGVARGDVAIGLTGMTSVLQLLKAGQVQVIAATTDKRPWDALDVPTLKEQGVDKTAGYTFGIWVNAKTPQAIVDRIVEGVTQAASTPETIKRLNNLSFSPPNHRAYEQEQAKENAEFFEIAKRIGLKPQ